MIVLSIPVLASRMFWSPALSKACLLGCSVLDNAWLLKRGYLIYSCCVAEEVRACLEHPEDLSNGPSILVPYAVSDGNLITSRWYMDAELFSECFADALQQRMRAESGTR